MLHLAELVLLHIKELSVKYLLVMLHLTYRRYKITHHKEIKTGLSTSLVLHLETLELMVVMHI